MAADREEVVALLRSIDASLRTLVERGAAITPPAQVEPADTFATFWDAYPRHVGKADALKAWNRLKADAATVQRILDALAWQRQQDTWTKDGGKFIPHPATWLNARRWEDERPLLGGLPAEDDPGWESPLDEWRPGRKPQEGAQRPAGTTNAASGVVARPWHDALQGLTGGRA